MNARYGITLLSLVITIVILLLLAGVTISTFNNGNILGNTESAAEQSKISAKKTEIELAIIKVITKSNGEVSIEDIIEELEKEGIINKGDGNPGNGQVKVQPDGYIFEITEDEKGNWEVEYIGKGDIERAEITISVTPNTTLLTDKVIVTVTAKADSGIKKFVGTTGDNKTYTSGTKEIEEICEITKNGTYTFTVENNNGKTASKEIIINNILEGTIQIKPDNTMPTKDNVKITITWPSGSDRGIKEIKVGNNEWQIATGGTSTVEVTQNCTITARIRNSNGEVISSSLNITNIDKAKPTVTVTSGTETIKQGDSYEISKYFTYTANGTAEISSVIYTDTSDENKVVTNTNTLAVGTHTIKCTVTKETGLSASATKIIIVEQGGPPSIETGTDINENTTEYQDKNGNKVVVPGGFKVRTDLGTTVEEGIVIEDSEGNQFVWIPVGTITKTDGSTVTIDLGRYTFDATTGTPTMGQSAENYEQEVAIETNFKELATFRESDGSQTNTTSYSLQKWINSALVNGGYYIARYEASFGSGEASGTITNQKPQFKQSTNKADTMTYTQGILWNNITQADASKVCRNMYIGNSYVESDLINSYAWDTAITFIQKCSNNSNYANKTDGNGTIKNTGETGDVLCNIYDMAANLGEWTTEFSAYSKSDCSTTYYPNTYRGATYTLNTNSTAKRNYSTSSTSTAEIGFRGTLTIVTETPKIKLSTTKWTTEDVIVTVEWPKFAEGLTKQIKIGDNEWKEYTGAEAVSENCTVRARLIDENGKTYGATVSVTITNIVEVADIAIVEEPVIMEGMTAVYWSTDGGKTASTTEEGASPIYSKIDSVGEPSSTGTDNPNFNWGNWYEYIGGDNSTDTRISRWANAITDDGSYWVWIPRFKYKITDQPTESGSNNAGKIDVKFISTTEKMGTSGYTTAANADGEILTTDSNGYIIHPAFENGSNTGKNNDFANGEWDSELPGFWIAKYEMSMEDGNGNPVNTADNTIGNVALGENVKMVSKPNVSSWDCIQIGQAYQNCLNYDITKNSHLIKNSEWGAVTYLAHSQYGRNRNKVVSSANNTCYTTGAFSEGLFQPTYKYNQEVAMKTSTTGNIYGVYDMGTVDREYISGWDTKSSSTDVTDYGKAVDGTVYFRKGGLSDRTKTAYSNGTEDEKIKEVSRMGEGIKELYGWFNTATMNCVNNTYPFLTRGGEYVDNLNDGNFNSIGDRGSSRSITSFRVILSDIR